MGLNPGLLPFAGSLIIEEDAPGDAMYVVLSGQCHIWARPAHAAAIPQQQSVPMSSVVRKAAPAEDSDSSDSDSSAEEGSHANAVVARVAKSDAEHSATFWIHKYMQQVW